MYQRMHFFMHNVLVYSVNIKTLKTLEHVSISIQIILRELPRDDLNRDRNMLECFKCF